MTSIVTTTLQPPEGGNAFPVTIDLDGTDPELFHGPTGRAAINLGIEGEVKGWEQARYFGSHAEFQAFKASGLSVPEYFARHPDPWWAGLSQQEREREIYVAGQRIQKTYGQPGDPGYGNPLEYPQCHGRARFEAEARLGKPHEQTY